jgi:hypothetical protein
MSKTITVPFLTLMLVVSVFVGSAGAYTINDTTDVGKGKSDFADTSYTYVDVIGDAATFDILGIDALTQNNNLILDIFTNFPENGTTVGSVDVFAADLAIDVGSSGLDGKFDFGVAFTNEEGLNKGSLYAVDSWKTSYDHFESTSGYYYGEEWINPYEGAEIPVVGTIASGTAITDTGITWFSGDANFNHRIHLEIALSALGIAAGESAEIGLFLASANCANDIIYGEIEATSVPIGSTALLFGTGFFGLLRFWRRRR